MEVGFPRETRSDKLKASLGGSAGFKSSSSHLLTDLMQLLPFLGPRFLIWKGGLKACFPRLWLGS